MVKVAASMHFVHWIMALGDGVKIVAPDSLVEQMQNFEMNEDTDCSVRKQIMNRTNRKKEGERLG